MLLYVLANCTAKFQLENVVLQRPLKYAFTNLFKHWSTKHIQQIIAIGVQSSTMKVVKSMEIICENVAKWLFMAWDKLRLHKEMIAFGWGQCGILKAWDWQIQNDIMRVNFEGSLFANSSNLVEHTNEEIKVLDFYLDMDVLDCLCHCVSNLDITNDFLDLNGFIDMWRM